MSSAEWEAKVTEGDTFKVLFQLLDAGEPFDASGMTLAVVLKGNDEEEVAVTDEGWETAATSVAKFTLPAEGLDPQLSPYTLHWVVTNGAQVISYPTPALRLTVTKR